MSEAKTEFPSTEPGALGNGSPPVNSNIAEENTETEMRLSRKREREVSLEPVTTPKAGSESDPVSRERRDTRVPAKKNRTLDSTVEEDDHNVSRSRSNSASPPVSASPRQELKMRVRQISQGVEDLQWTNAQAQEAAYDVDIELPDATPTNDKTPEAQAVGASLNPGGVLAGGITPESFSATPESREPYLEPPLPAPEATTSLTPAGFNPSSAKTFPADYSESGEKEKGLKRKFLERGTSQGPQEAAQAASEPLKRARDDADKDDNPRETKRPSPPPSPKVTEAKTNAGGGFMAYASTSSPFANVKGRNLFAPSQRSPSPSPSTSTISAPPSRASSFAVFGETTPAPTPVKPPSFGTTFGSSGSPFAVRTKSPTGKWGRSKSPPGRSGSNASAFSAYATGGVTAFSSRPASKKARADSPSGSGSGDKTPTVFGTNGSADSGAEEETEGRTSFGDKLRASGEGQDTAEEDAAPKVVLTEQAVTTGEEGEDTIHQVRGKLYTLDEGAWKERGTGLLKLNVRESDGGGARLVMRKEAVFTLLLNVTLFKGMKCSLAQDPRYLRFSVIENGATTHYNLRVSNAKIAQELLDEIHANLPT